MGLSLLDLGSVGMDELGRGGVQRRRQRRGGHRNPSNPGCSGRYPEGPFVTEGFLGMRFAAGGVAGALPG